MSIPEDLLKNEGLANQIIEQVEKENIFSQVPENILHVQELKDFLDISVQEGPKAAYGRFADNKTRFAESIILTVGRPAILVQNDSFKVDASDIWAARLETARANIEKAIRSVGRIEVTDHPRGFSYVGTGWLVTQDVIVTNRHVAQAFAARKGDDEFAFKTNRRLNREIGVNIDFREEFQVGKQEQFNALEVLYIEEDFGPDIAFLKISKNTLSRQGIVMDLNVDLEKKAIPLTKDPIEEEIDVAVIGYPARDSRRNPLSDEEMDKIFGNIYDVKRLQPGKIKSERSNLITHDASTLGGNSGSVVLDLTTGEAVGLHYAGIFKQENMAVSASVIRDRMEKLGLEV